MLNRPLTDIFMQEVYFKVVPDGKAWIKWALENKQALRERSYRIFCDYVYTSQARLSRVQLVWDSLIQIVPLNRHCDRGNG